jgi:hypothetical protein
MHLYFKNPDGRYEPVMLTTRAPGLHIMVDELADPYTVEASMEPPPEPPEEPEPK